MFTKWWIPIPERQILTRLDRLKNPKKFRSCCAGYVLRTTPLRGEKEEYSSQNTEYSNQKSALKRAGTAEANIEAVAPRRPRMAIRRPQIGSRIPEGAAPQDDSFVYHILIMLIIF